MNWIGVEFVPNPELYCVRITAICYNASYMAPI